MELRPAKKARPGRDLGHDMTVAVDGDELEGRRGQQILFVGNHLGVEQGDGASQVQQAQANQLGNKGEKDATLVVKPRRHREAANARCGLDGETQAVWALRIEATGQRREAFGLKDFTNRSGAQGKVKIPESLADLVGGVGAILDGPPSSAIRRPAR